MKYRSVITLRLFTGLAFFLLFSTAFAQPSGEVWTLKRCLEYARENNITVRQVQLNSMNAKYDLIQSRADLFPTLNASAGHNFYFGLSFDPTSLKLQDQRYQSSSFGASSRFIIFNGLSNYYQVMANSYTYKAAQQDFQQAVDDVSLNIIQLYMQVLFAQERLEIVKQQVDVLSQQVERTGMLYDAGVVTRGDFLSIQSQLATQEVTQVNGENSLATAKLNLIQALNLPGMSMDIIIEKPDLSQFEVKEMDPTLTAENVFNTAITIRPNIKGKEYRLLGAKRTLAVIRGGYYPSLAFTASISTAFSELRKANPIDPLSPTIPFFDQLQQNNSQQLSFGLTVPIFNGLQTRMAVQKSKISVKQAEFDLLNEQLTLRNTIQQAYTDARAAYKVYISNTKNLEALEESFNYAKEKFEAKVINAVEFNDASTRYFNARTELLIAQYDYIFKTKVLDFYRGETLEF